MTFEYHAFISYTGADRDWARRLRDDLFGRGLNVFFEAGRRRRVVAATLTQRHYLTKVR